MKAGLTCRPPSLWAHKCGLLWSALEIEAEEGNTIAQRSHMRTLQIAMTELSIRWEKYPLVSNGVCSRPNLLRLSLVHWNNSLVLIRVNIIIIILRLNECYY